MFRPWSDFNEQPLNSNIQTVNSTAEEKKETEPKTQTQQIEELKVKWEAIVKLNVGGQKFTTSKDTLTKYEGCMLAAMFSGKYELAVDDKGRVFIDRDGKLFRHVLAYLREGPDWLAPHDDQLLLRLQKEFTFYGLDLPLPLKPSFQLDMRRSQMSQLSYETSNTPRGYSLRVRKQFLLVSAKVMLVPQDSFTSVNIVLFNHLKKIITSNTATQLGPWYDAPINHILEAGFVYYITFLRSWQQNPTEYAHEVGDNKARLIGEYLEVNSVGCSSMEPMSVSETNRSLVYVFTCKDV